MWAVLTQVATHACARMCRPMLQTVNQCACTQHNASSKTDKTAQPQPPGCLHTPQHNQHATFPFQQRKTTSHVASSVQDANAQKQRLCRREKRHARVMLRTLPCHVCCGAVQPGRNAAGQLHTAAQQPRFSNSNQQKTPLLSPRSNRPADSSPVFAVVTNHQPPPPQPLL